MHDREELGVGELRAVVEAFRDGLQAHRHAINRLNVYPVPDGDTGTNMALTVDSVLVEIGAVEPPGTMAEVCSAMSHGALLGARGNSGVILSQVLRGIAETFAPHDSIDGRCLAAALTVAADAAYAAVMKPVEGTILTVLRAAANGAAACDASEPAEAGVGLAGGPSVATVASAARDAGRDALRRTPEMLPVLAQAGVVDAGGTGLLLLLDAVLHVAAGETMPPPPDLSTIGGPGLVADSELHAHGGEGVGDLRYEVMYLLEANDGAIPAFKDVWAGLGDSIVVVGGGGLWNCHIHTDDVGGAVEAGIDVGRPRRIRVTDLAEQVEEERWVREATQPLDRGADPVAPVATAVVAVAAAPGIGRIFHSLGVQRLVPGGPTMNPSTAELLAAVEEAPSGDVIILPNDPNIVAVARQVDGETAKHVTVVATTSVTEALARAARLRPTGQRRRQRRGDGVAGERRAHRRGHPGHPWLRQRSRTGRGRGLDRARPFRRQGGGRLGRRRRVRAARRDGGVGPRDHHARRGRGRHRRLDPPGQRVAEGQPAPGRARDPPRRPAALPVPVRDRVSQPPPLTWSDLDELEVGVLRGVGEKRSAALAAVDVLTVGDLLRYYPRRYVDRTREARVVDVVPGDEALVVATVTSVDTRRTRSRKAMVEVSVADDTGTLRCTFFNQAWRARQLTEGTTAAFFGKVDLYRQRRQMVNPLVDLVGDRTGRIVPIYPQSEKAGLTTWEVAGWVAEALRRAGGRGIADPVPGDLRRRHDLLSREEALHHIHAPESMAAKEEARRRLVFDELFRVQTSLVRRKREIEESRRGVTHVVDGPLVTSFLSRLPVRRDRSPATPCSRPSRSTSPGRARCTASCRATSVPARRWWRWARCSPPSTAGTRRR